MQANVMRWHLVVTTSIALVAAICFGPSLLGQAQPKGIALVIGNGAYRGQPLSTPPNDATEIADALRQLGFKVQLGSDLKLDAMRSALDTLRNDLVSKDLPAVFYFAGHGVQLNGVNYMVPIDAGVSVAPDIPRATVSLDEVFRALGSRRSSPNVVILDACRANPFSFVSTTEWVPGLAPPVNASTNTLVAFSTNPGNVAADGIGFHSPYTRALLRYMRQPGIPVAEVFQNVRIDVQENTDREQVPWENTSLTKPLYFRDPVFLLGQITDADDDALFLLDGHEVLDWNNDGSSVKQLPLQAGKNELVIKVYNQRSYTGGIPPFGHQPEGWRYTAIISGPNGAVLANVHDAEDRPVDNGPHHGKLFTVARFSVLVNESDGSVQLVQTQ